MESVKQSDLDHLLLKLYLISRNHDWHTAHADALGKAIDIIKTIKLGDSSKSLIVLDLNGVLLDKQFFQTEEEKARFDPTPSCYAGKFAVWLRPGAEEFIRNLLIHHDVAIWSSAKFFNTQQLVDSFIPKELQKQLLFIWGQEECTAVQTESGAKVIYTKDPKHIWEKYPQYQNCTKIIDDSSEKIQSECPYQVKICRRWTRNDVDLNASDLLQVIVE
jgi:hypothetical protein